MAVTSNPAPADRENWLCRSCGGRRHSEFTITVANTGNVQLFDVEVVHSKLNIDQVFTVLAAGVVVNTTGSYGPVLESDLPVLIVNTASATGAPLIVVLPVGPVTDTQYDAADEQSAVDC